MGRGVSYGRRRRVNRSRDALYRPDLHGAATDETVEEYRGTLVRRSQPHGGYRVRFSAQQRVGTYELVRPLGEGAFAEVWLARHHSSLGFSRQVAVKVLKPERDADPKYVQDLLAEAALLAELRHPSIVQVYSVEEIDGVVLVSMELVGGGSLLDLLHAARRPAR